jgi:3-hydroxyisobutyrate dehydrogenase
MQLGFIGFGHLGKAIAVRLLNCGHTLTAWNRSHGKLEDIEVKKADSPAAVTKEAEIIFVCVFDSHVVYSILTQEDGLLSNGISGKIIVDLTTNHFRDVVEFHKLSEKAGAIYLETPVLGSVVPASKGALTILISGDKKGYEKAKPVLQDIGKHLFYLEKPGLAIKMKLINNLALGSFMATIAEALAIGEDIGLKKEEILDILSVGGGDSLVLNAKKKKLIDEDFSTHFSNALIYKDLHCLQDLVYEQKKTLFTGAVVKELFARTFEQGIDQEDFSAVYKIFKRD